MEWKTAQIISVHKKSNNYKDILVMSTVWQGILTEVRSMKKKNNVVLELAGLVQISCLFETENSIKQSRKYNPTCNICRSTNYQSILFQSPSANLLRSDVFQSIPINFYNTQTDKIFNVFIGLKKMLF